MRPGRNDPCTCGSGKKFKHCCGRPLAPGIDDARVREHQVDQAHVPEVVWHLVDEKGLAAAIDTRAGEVLLAELEEFIRAESREDPRIARIVSLGPEAPQAGDDLLHVRQFLRAFHLRVRGEDLLEQRRARARKPDDEDGVAARMTPPGAAGEELRGTDLDLLLRVAFDQLGLVAAFGALELVTQPVVMERVGKIALVFVRLAECEAQVVSVYETRRRRRHRGLHPCHLLRLEAVGLEVGEAPVRITEVRPAGGGATVGINRRLGLPERLQRRVLRLIPHELLEFAARFLIAVQLGEHEGVLLARAAVVGCALEYRGEQHLRIEVHLMRHADAGKKPHRLDVITVFEQVGACLLYTSPSPRDRQKSRIPASA